MFKCSIAQFIELFRAKLKNQMIVIAHHRQWQKAMLINESCQRPIVVCVYLPGCNVCRFCRSKKPVVILLRVMVYPAEKGASYTASGNMEYRGQCKVYGVHDDHGGLRYANPPYEKWRNEQGT
ncbi:MAG: hypothetical protein GY820_01395 [Gammaproteobacteria bacterium]|nr:hypothetical protein [Gammaproteobacteria bacterium]